MFRQSHCLRCWAVRVLLVWLFALGVGVANACLAAQQFGGTNEVSSTMHEAAAQGGQQVAVADCGEHGAAVPGSPSDDAGTSSCQSFCERAGVTMTPLKSIDHLQALALPVPMVVTAVPLPAPVAPPPSEPPRDRSRPVSVHLEFLRLAL